MKAEVVGGATEKEAGGAVVELEGVGAEATIEARDCCSWIASMGEGEALGMMMPGFGPPVETPGMGLMPGTER